MTTIGVAVLARPTFDVPFAEETAGAAWDRLADLGHELVGSPELILDDDSLEARAAELSEAELDALVIVQATFADSTLAAAIADANPAPLVLWAIPEARTGGRLRLNSFCGINLAGYRLTREERRYRYIYRHPAHDGIDTALRGAIEVAPEPLRAIGAVPATADIAEEPRAAAARAREQLAGVAVGIVGEHPAGFEPCAYDADVMAATIGVRAETATLGDLFAHAAAAPAEAAVGIRQRVAGLGGIDEVDQDELDRSLRLHLGLRELIDERGWSAVATRCWPECFTEFGGAMCAPHSLLNDDGIPGCCEADAYATVTSLALQWLSGGPAFVADLVDIDIDDGTGVFWHCGLAPMAMAAPDVAPRATVHSNRRKPLLNEFPLRPGRVTIARLSQSRGVARLTIGGGEMLPVPLPFSGTAGTMRFDRPAAEVMDTIMNEGHEHHYGIAYGDVRPELTALAAELDMAVIEL